MELCKKMLFIRSYLFDCYQCVDINEIYSSNCLWRALRFCLVTGFFLVNFLITLILWYLMAEPYLRIVRRFSLGKNHLKILLLD